MITKTALQNPAFLARVRAAVRLAVIKAQRHPLGVGLAAVENRRNRLSLVAIWRKGGPGLEFHDSRDNDVTAAVLQALRGQAASRLAHYTALANEAAQHLPLVQVDYDSGPIEGLPLYIRPELKIVERAA